MYAYMRNSEDYSAPSKATAAGLGTHPDRSNYGHSGPVQISFNQYVARASNVWLKALLALGLPLNEQPLAGDNVGAAAWIDRSGLDYQKLCRICVSFSQRPTKERLDKRNRAEDRLDLGDVSAPRIQSERRRIPVQRQGLYRSSQKRGHSISRDHRYTAALGAERDR